MINNKKLGNVIFIIAALAANYIGITITKMIIDGGLF